MLKFILHVVVKAVHMVPFNARPIPQYRGMWRYTLMLLPFLFIRDSNGGYFPQYFKQCWSTMMRCVSISLHIE